MTFTLEIDDTTLLLLFLLIILSLLPRLFSTTPAAHPLLFAKQAETSTVRRPGRSAVFRHWSTGSAARLAVRPEQGVDGVKELIKSGNGTRWIAGTSVQLPRLVKELEKGLEALLVPGKEEKGGINRIITCVTTTPTTLLPLVLLNLLPSVSSSSTNAAAGTSSTNRQKYQLVTLPRARFLTRALGTFGDARLIVVSLTEAQAMLAILPSFAPSSEGAQRYLLVLPTSSSTKREEEHPPIPADLGKMGQEKGYEVVLFDEVLRTGGQALAKVDGEEKASDDVYEGKSDPDAIHSFAVLPPVTSTTTADDHVNVDADADADPQILTITNSNLTAGVTGILSLFPATHRPSASSNAGGRGGKKDVFLSSVDLAEPVGLALAMSALYVGADLVFVPPSQSLHDLSVPGGAPLPTVAFLSPAQLRTLSSTIAERAKSNLLYPLARRQAQARLRDGSVSRSGWAEAAVWRAARAGVASGLRCVVVIGQKSSDALSVSEVEEAFIHLAVPIIRTYIDPRATAPVTATHFFDYQLVPYIPGEQNVGAAAGKMHSGPPGVNVEIELRGEEVERGLEKGGDPKGAMYVRGPTVLLPFSNSVGGMDAKLNDDGWVGLDASALARPNGTFAVL